MSGAHSPFALALVLGVGGAIGLAGAGARAEDAPPPEASPAPGAAAEPAPAASASRAAGAASAPLEVTVQGERAPPGSTALRRREIREMPGVLDDPYRAIEVQPGVTPTASGLPYYFIRGAPPGNIGYFFDGIEVPLLFHVGGGPSVIPAALVRRVELHPGPAPVDAGRFAGAVVAAESTPPPGELRGEGALRGADIGGLVEGPLRADVDVLAGGHYAAGAKLLSALVPSVDLAYADYQARAIWRSRPGERLSVLAFGSYDRLATRLGEGGARQADTLIDSDFHRVDLRYERESPAGDTTGGAMTLGLDRSRKVGVERARALKLDARLTTVRRLGSSVVRGGVDLALSDYAITPRERPCPVGCPPGTSDVEVSEDQLVQAFSALFPSRLDVVIGAWADAVVALDRRTTIQPGLRVDHYASLGNTAVAVDPRVVGRFSVNDHLRLIPAFGVASQPPGFAPLPALQIGGIPGGLQRSLQSSFGVEATVGPIEGVASVFRQTTFHLTDPIGTGRGTSLGPERFLTRSLGDAYGIELGARGALRRDIFFVASYTLSRATRARGGRVVPSAYDRTHVAQVALLYDLGHGVRAGVRHVFYSGFPADEASPWRAPSEHPARVRPFYRFDVRVSKRWTFGERRYLGLVLDLQNATLAKEVFDVACGEHGCTPRTLGPITIPGLALEAGF